MAKNISLKPFTGHSTNSNSICFYWSKNNCLYSLSVYRSMLTINIRAKHKWPWIWFTNMWPAKRQFLVDSWNVFKINTYVLFVKIFHSLAQKHTLFCFVFLFLELFKKNPLELLISCTLVSMWMHHTQTKGGKGKQRIHETPRMQQLCWSIGPFLLNTKKRNSTASIK